MGNKSSTPKINTSLAEEIDRIASKYILSQNFNDMNKLSEKGHCDKVAILTAKVIDQTLNPLEQKEMVDRIDNGMGRADRASDFSNERGKDKENGKEEKKDDEDDEDDEGEKKEKKK